MKSAQKKGNIDPKKIMSSPISPYISMPQGRTESTAKGTTGRKRRVKDGFTKDKEKTDEVPMTSEFKVDFKSEVPQIGKRANRGYNPKYHDAEVFPSSQSSKKSKQEEQAPQPRKVGRPPKDKSLINLKKQAQQLTKKALKAQKHLEFSNLIARDLKIPQIQPTKLHKVS